MTGVSLVLNKRRPKWPKLPTIDDATAVNTVSPCCFVQAFDKTRLSDHKPAKKADSGQSLDDPHRISIESMFIVV